MSNRNRRKNAILKIIFCNLIPIILTAGVISWFYWNEAMEKDKEIDMLTTTVADVDQLKQKLEKNIKEKDEKISELQSALASETEEREKIEQQLEDLEKEKMIIKENLEYVKSLIKPATEKIGFLMDERDQRESELRTKNGEIVSLMGHGEELAKSIRKKEELISGHTSELKLLQEEMQILQQQTIQLENSYHTTLDIAKKLNPHLYEVTLKNKKTMVTRNERKAEKITVEFGLNYYRREELKGKVFAAEIYNANTNKTLTLDGDASQNYRDRAFFTYTGGKVKLSFINKGKKEKGVNYAIRLYYFPIASSIDEAKKSDFDIQIRAPLLLQAPGREKKVIPVQKLHR